jgi:hypothetical protein
LLKNKIPPYEIIFLAFIQILWTIFYCGEYLTKSIIYDCALCDAYRVIILLHDTSINRA